MDVDGRVVRLDTFSKTIAPGCRLGWITAQPAIVERLTRITETSTQQPSGFVQSMVAELILGQQQDDSSAGRRADEQSWQMDGWVRWLAGLRAGYERRMQAMCRILDGGRYLIRADGNTTSDTALGSTDDLDAWEVVDKVQMYDFAWPAGGMFVWLRACFETHPLRSKYPPEKLSRALWAHLTRRPYLCLVAPGRMFAATPGSVDDAVPYMRLSFAAMDEAEVSDISRRLVDGFRSFWQRESLDDEDDALGLENMGRLAAGFGC
jgi:DNA-binding transcriptional MocR family regulator